MDKRYKVVVMVGAGVVGGATGMVLRRMGHDVRFVDISGERVNQLREQGYPASLVSEMDLSTADVIFVAVPTPTQNGSVQLTYLASAVTSIGHNLKDRIRARQAKDYPVVAIRSTIPVWTVRDLVIPTLERTSGGVVGTHFGVGVNPEFLRESHAESDFAHAQLILIGADDDKTREVLASVYKEFHAEIFVVPTHVAEITKYVHNLYNALRTSFFNELRAAFAATGLELDDVQTSFSLANKTILSLGEEHGTRPLGPFGGSCLPKDLKAIIAICHAMDLPIPLLEAVWYENELEAERSKA